MGPIVCISLVHDFIRLFHLCTSYFSTSPRGDWGHAISPFLILNLKIGSIVCISLVHDCMRLFLFVQLLLFFLPLPEGAVDMLSPPFLILDSKMGPIICISLVHDCIHLFLFVHQLLFYLSQGGGLGTCYSSFSDFGFQNWLNRLYFVST